MKNRKKIIFLFCTLLVIMGLFLFFGDIVQASTIDDQTAAFIGERGANIEQTNDPRLIVSLIIRASLGLLGILFVMYLIFGGVLIMTAAGSEDRVEDGKKAIRNSIIGVVIVMLSWGITVLVTSIIEGKTSADCVYVREGGGYFFKNSVSIIDQPGGLQSDPFNQGDVTPFEYDLSGAIPCDPTN